MDIKRIAFICGPTTSMLRPSYLGRVLAERGYDVSVVIPPGRKAPELFGLEKHPVSVYRLPPGRSARAAVVDQLRAIRPQVVHCVDAGRATVPGTLAYAQAARVLSLVDMPDWMPAWQRLRSKLTVVFARTALARADAVALASQELLDYYRRRGSYHARLYYLPFAVDMQVVEKYRDRAPAVRARYGDLKLLTYLGTLIPQYSPEEALRLARVLAFRGVTDFRLLYVGRGPLQPHLAKLARRWGIAERVEFVGFVPEEDLPGYLVASDVLLCPLADNLANRYRCPSKAFWYLGARRPIVATQMGEVFRAIGEDGLYYDYGNAEDFADKVELALAGHAPLPAEARAYAHSWQAVADRYEALLEDMTGT